MDPAVALPKLLAAGLAAAAGFVHADRVFRSADGPCAASMPAPWPPPRSWLLPAVAGGPVRRLVAAAQRGRAAGHHGAEHPDAGNPGAGHHAAGNPGSAGSTVGHDRMRLVAAIASQKVGAVRGQDPAWSEAATAAEVEEAHDPSLASRGAVCGNPAGGRRLVHAGRIRLQRFRAVAGHGGLLHRFAHGADVRDGDVHRHLHPFLCHRLHAR